MFIYTAFMMKRGFKKNKSSLFRPFFPKYSENSTFSPKLDNSRTYLMKERMFYKMNRNNV